jgi:hypothetical protein
VRALLRLGFAIVAGVLLSGGSIAGPERYEAAPAAPHSMLAGPHPRSRSSHLVARDDPELVEGSLGGFAPRSSRRRFAPVVPELPRSRVDTSEPALDGRTIQVRAGESLQRALDDAQPGDRILLQAGATYHGPFRLPQKNGNEWIVIASDELHRLPAGERVAPDDARYMPRLVSASRHVIAADSGAHHYRFAGVEIASARDVFLHNLVELGSEHANLTEIPHHLIFDRSYIHGDPRKGGRRGIAMNARDAAVINSYLSDFKEVGADSQAVSGWNGPGPLKLENNYLEAAGENVMFGGADPAVNGLVPGDIEVLRNHLSKPLRWKVGHPSYEGSPWAVKNLFELKNARRVLIEGNLLEHNWPHAQNGFAVLFTVRNQDGSAPWSAVEDVTFRNNVVRHAAAGFNILGRDDIHASRPTRRILIENNLMSDIGGTWGGNGRLFQLLNGTSDVAIVRNTIEHATGGIVFGGDHDPHTGFAFLDNIAPDNGAGFVGSGTSPGRQSIERYFPGSAIRGNVFRGGKADHYPPGNNFSQDDKNGRGAGADMRALQGAMNEVGGWRQ